MAIEIIAAGCGPGCSCMEPSGVREALTPSAILALAAHRERVERELAVERQAAVADAEADLSRRIAEREELLRMLEAMP